MAVTNKTQVPQKGFSLLESMIALAIMSISLFAIFTTLRSAASAIHTKNIEARALLLAETKLNETKIGKLTSFETNSGKMDRFTWEVKISPTYNESLGLIKSSVSWMEKNIEYKARLNTFVKMQNLMD